MTGLLCRVGGLLCLLAAVLVGILIATHYDRSARETVRKITIESRNAVTQLSPALASVTAPPATELERLRHAAVEPACARAWHYLLVASNERVVTSCDIVQTAGYTFEIRLSGHRLPLRSLALAVTVPGGPGGDGGGGGGGRPILYAPLDAWDPSVGALTIAVHRDTSSVSFTLPASDVRVFPAQWNGRPVSPDWSPCYGSELVLALRARICSPRDPTECWAASIGETAASPDRFVRLAPCCAGTCCVARRCTAKWSFREDCDAGDASFAEDAGPCNPVACLNRQG